eukprot:g7574.t1
MAKWNNYRLGDVVKQLPDALGCSDYPDTIACAYTRATTEPEDYTVLLRILREKVHPDVPGSKDIVIHMRVGDGIKGPDCWRDVADCFSNAYQITAQAWARMLYALPRTYYEPLLPALPSARDGYRVVLVGNAGHNTRHGNSKQGLLETEYSATYVRNIAAFFEAHGYDVFVRDNRDPDSDFIYMARAQTFVQGGGGYSALAAQMLAVLTTQIGTYLVLSNNKLTGLVPALPFNQIHWCGIGGSNSFTCPLPDGTTDCNYDGNVACSYLMPPPTPAPTPAPGYKCASDQCALGGSLTLEQCQANCGKVALRGAAAELAHA